MGASIARASAEINLKDGVSAVAEKISKNIRKASQESGKSLEHLGEAGEKSLRKVSDSLDKLGSKMQATGLAMSAAITAPIMLAAKQIVDSGRKMEGYSASLESITGSSQKAAKQLKMLEGMSFRTATSYELLVKASTGVTAGFKNDSAAANAVLERFARLSSVLNVSKADFDRLAQNLIQISGTSRLAGDELREMANILPNFRPLLEKAFGTADSEKLAKLGISGRQALEGIAKAIDESGIKVKTDTLNAQLNILDTTLFKLKVSAAQTFIPIVKSITEKMIPAIDKIREKLEKMTPAQRNLALGFAAAAAAAGPLLLTLGSIAKAIVSIGELKGIIAGLGLFSSAAGGAEAAAGGLAVALPEIIIPLVAIAATVAAVALAYQKNFLGIKTVVDKFIAEMAVKWEAFSEEFIKTAQMVGDTLQEVWAEIYKAIGPILDAITNEIKASIQLQFNIIRDGLGFIYDLFMTALGQIQIANGAGWSTLSDTVKASTARMTGYIYNWAADAAKAVVEMVKATLKAFVGLVPGAALAIDELAKLLDGPINWLRSQGAAAEYLAKSYQGAADKTRALRLEQERLARLKAAKKTDDSALGLNLGGGNNGGGGGGTGGGNKSIERQASELTSEIVLAMGRAVKSPGGGADAACAMFASKVIAQFTNGITDEGGKIEWNARNLRDMLTEKFGQAIVSAKDALPGALAFRRGRGPSGVHVGISLGNGQVMDMNGQRDGRRNTFGMSKASDWKGFVNIPKKRLDKKFEAGDVTDRFKQIFDEELAASEAISAAEEKRLKARAEIMDSVRSAISGYKKELDLAGTVTEAEKARWEVTKGGYKEAAPLAKAYLIAAAMQADSARAASASAAKEAEALRQKQADRLALMNSVRETLLGMTKEVDLISATTEAERMRWEVTKGGYKEAAPLAKAFLLIQSAIVDKARASKEFAEKQKEVWKRVFEAASDMTKKQTEGSQSALSEAMSEISLRMKELTLSAEELMRLNLTEQFRYLFPEVKDAASRASMIKGQVDKVIEGIKNNKGVEEKIAQIQNLAYSMKDIFSNALEDMFEHGFRGFFDSVIGGFRDMLRQMAIELVKSQINNALLGIFKSLGASGSVLDIFRAPGRSTGGRVFAGQPYMTSESGPELFIPETNGRIVPNQRLGYGGQDSSTINVYIQTTTPGAWNRSEAQAVGEVFKKAKRLEARNG